MPPSIPAPDWQKPRCYAHLRDADRRLFAWEWLRRCPAYRRAWQRYGHDPEGRVAVRVARRFGLVALEDPTKDASAARPMWRSGHDPQVVSANAETLPVASSGRFDILRLAPFAHVTVSQGGSEHWLFSEAGWLLRLDVVEGTLLGGPALLRFRLEGMCDLAPRLRTLDDLIRLFKTPEAGVGRPTSRRTQRWIAELRTADALEQGASHRQIARRLFGDLADKEWRLDSDAYRLRTQRLVRSARARLRQPVGAEWFAG